MMRGFKTFSSRQINKFRNQAGVPVWQRGYYDRLIRNDRAGKNIRQYIFNHPSNWIKDQLHPDRVGNYHPIDAPLKPMPECQVSLESFGGDKEADRQWLESQNNPIQSV